MNSIDTPFVVNQEKLKKLAASSRIGGKGTIRRKVKRVHHSAGDDDKKLQTSLKRLSVNAIAGIDEVNIFKENGEVLHFANPKVQASIASNTFAISGNCEVSEISSLLPGILNQLGPDELLKKIASKIAESGTKDDDNGNVDNENLDVPELVGCDFEEASMV